MFGWGDIVNFVKSVFHVVTNFVKTAVKAVTQAVKAAAAVVATTFTQYVKPAAAAVVRGATKAGIAAFNFVGQHSTAIGIGIGVAAFVGCTVLTVGACGGVAAAITAGASGAVSFAGAKYDGHGTASAVLYGGVNAALNYVPFAGRGLEAVRWFGEGRQYKSMWLALTGGQGLINNKAGWRFVRQVWNSVAGQATSDAIDWGYSKL